MFERFTEEARRSIVLAQEEASNLGHERLGTEHLLLGVIKEGSLSGLFNQSAVTLERARMAVRRQVSERAPRAGPVPEGARLFTDRAKAALGEALRVSMRGGGQEIQPRHLLVGLLFDPASGAVEALTRGLGVDAGALVTRAAGHPAGGRPDPDADPNAASDVGSPTGRARRTAAGGASTPRRQMPSMPEWLGPPDDWGGRIVPFDDALITTPDVALVVRGLSAYPTGFVVGLALHLRVPDDGTIGRSFLPQPLRPGEMPTGPADRFRLRIEFADGTSVSSTDLAPLVLSAVPPGDRVIAVRGGGGGHRRYDAAFWVWPLPPRGDLVFVCEWAAQAVWETRTVIDAGLVIDAANRCQRLWDAEP